MVFGEVFDGQVDAEDAEAREDGGEERRGQDEDSEGVEGTRCACHR